MLKRALSSIVAVALFLGLCFGGLLPFAMGATVVAALAVWEWITAYQRAQTVEAKAGDSARLPAWQNTLNIVIAVIGIAFPLLVYLTQQRSGWQHPLRFSPADALKLVTPVLAFALLTLRAAKTGTALGDLRRWHGVVALIYIGLLMSSLVWLRGLNYHYMSAPGNILASYTQIWVKPFGPGERGAWLMLLVAVCVWATDTGAYLVGKSLGKHKLAPTVSPGKTIEGSLGGLVLALLTGALFGHWIHLPLPHGLAIGLIAGVMGQWGDLFESALKREIGLKDFGNLMPGHGGALDRIDSLLFVTPLAFCYLHLVAGY